jgi:hypothetical protein
MSDSTNPSFADDGAVIAFESRANLANDQTDMGVPQIFIYHIKSKTYAQITRENERLHGARVARFKRDWRVAYICDGVGYVYFLRADKRYHVRHAAGQQHDAPRPEPGTHFFVVATTGDLLNGTGTTAGHQIYQVNSYKRRSRCRSGLRRPLVPVPRSAAGALSAGPPSPGPPSLHDAAARGRSPLRSARRWRQVPRNGPAIQPEIRVFVA